MAKPLYGNANSKSYLGRILKVAKQPMLEVSGNFAQTRLGEEILSMRLNLA